MGRLLELQQVSKAFGGLTVISELDLHVDEGEIVSVIGPNGAGQTTLFNLITGVYEPVAGDILFSGESIKGLDPHKITRKGIARTFQTLRLFLNMSVRDNVMAAAYGHTRAGVFRSMLRTPGQRREEKEIRELFPALVILEGVRPPAESSGGGHNGRLSNPRLPILSGQTVGRIFPDVTVGKYSQLFISR